MTKMPIKNKIRVFFGGNFSPYQIIDKVIKNIGKHKSDIDNYIFHFFGYQRNKMPFLLKLIQKNKIQDSVHLNPPIQRNKLFRQLERSHIVLVSISGLKNPKIYDYAIPLKFYEALAFSKPILLYGGTKASKKALKKDQVGLICTDRDNIFKKLNQISQNYNSYHQNCAKTKYLRKEEAIKLDKIILNLAQ